MYIYKINVKHIKPDGQTGVVESIRFDKLKKISSADVNFVKAFAYKYMSCSTIQKFLLEVYYFDMEEDYQEYLEECAQYYTNCADGEYDSNFSAPIQYMGWLYE